MSNQPGYDELARRLRDRILETKRRQDSNQTQDAQPSRASSAVDTSGQIQSQFRVVRSLQDILSVSFTSHRLLVGPFLIRLRRFVRELLIPIFSRQKDFNSATVDLAEMLQGQISGSNTVVEALKIELSTLETLTKEANRLRASDLTRLLTSVEERNDGLRAQLESFRSKLDLLDSRLNEVSNAAEQLSALRQTLSDLSLSHTERIARVERKLRRLIYEITSEDTDRSSRAIPYTRESIIESPTDSIAGFDYAGFEERVRPSEEDLSAKQRRYLSHFAGVDNVLDVGCGNGEFLELLRQANITARGVDQSLDMILTCREKHLSVVRQDAIEYLQGLPDEGLGGIYSAQVVEHLPADKALGLIALAHRKLKSDGVLVIETLNPESLFVLYRWFWMDPTHQRLLHPETLRYSLETLGFRDIKLEFGTIPEAPVSPQLTVNGSPPELVESFNKWTMFVNQLLFGPQEYTVVARK